MLALACCGRGLQPRTPIGNDEQPTVAPPAKAPDAKTPLSPVKPPVDPKSPEAAVNIVERFAQLLERGRTEEAYYLVRHPEQSKDAERMPGPELIGGLHVEVGKARDPEGAAGSTYLSVPLRLTGRYRGRLWSGAGTAVLRRVNDVPGSTEEQRRWHIERIDWAPS